MSFRRILPETHICPRVCFYSYPSPVICVTRRCGHPSAPRPLGARSMYRLLTVFAAVLVVASIAGAQQYQRRATMVAGGRGDRGKCTSEVGAEGSADTETRAPVDYHFDG